MEARAERRQSTPRTSAHADVLVELTQSTYRSLLPSVLLSGAGLAGTTAVLARHYADRVLWIFAGLFGAVTLLRMAMVLIFDRSSRSRLSLRDAGRWQIVYSVSTLLFCATMAACTLYCLRRHDATSWMLCMLGTFMLCAGLVVRVGLYEKMIQASGLLMLLGLAAAVVASPDPSARIGILLICLFGYAFYQAVDSRFESVVDGIRNRRTLRLLEENDPLTGLTNRRHMEATLATICLLETPFALIFIDLRRFKAVNDTYGRPVGDLLLQRVGVRLKASVRRGDVVSRLGGDEFVILQVQGASQLSAESLARRVNRALSLPFEIEGQQVYIASATAIRLSRPDDREPRELLDRTQYTPYPPIGSNEAAGLPLSAQQRTA